ncbi:serine-rich adhesin for platelets [Drosophila elegans]|uniref:serine-rich adhesin for platelets n=1 Tax=Drosophila elegans TaxID=30023 RepID=UPI0007E6D48C|nr:serine-rich adhesin for platelets [Drosophila elegans]XP_041566638.1 serine-rich adhesin for platelets [Drosophila elegans]
MNVRKRPRLEMELGSTSTSSCSTSTSTSTSNNLATHPPGGHLIANIPSHSADLSEALVGHQSLILTSATGNALMSSQGAQIFLTICGDENSDDSQEYYAIKQEPGSDLDVHSLLPTNLQLPTGCEIYLVKDTASLVAQQQPAKAAIKLELETLSGEKRRATPAAAAACKPAVNPTPSGSTTTSVLYGCHAQAQRSQPETTTTSQTPTSKLEAYKKRDDKRRATHNEVERRRRDKINSWIFKLKEMLPSLSSTSSSSFCEASTSPSTSGSTSTTSTSTSSSSSSSNPKIGSNPSSSSGRTPPNDSKSQILIKACEYIKSMQGEIDTLRDCLREADGLKASNQALREELDRLKRQQQLQERFHTASGRSTFNVTLNSLNSSATSDLFEGIDTTPNLSAVSSLGFGKRGLLISDYDE